MTRQSIEIDLDSYVHNEIKTLPITGIHSSDFNLSGWINNRDSVISTNKVASRFDTVIGGEHYGLFDGTITDHWNSIVRSGLAFMNISSLRIYNEDTWTPVYERGEYTIYWKRLILYSSYHYSGIAERDNDRFEIQLRDDCILPSIECAIWKRDENFMKFPYINYTYDPANTNERRYTFDIDEDGLLFTNNDSSVIIGVEDIDPALVWQYWENKSFSNPAGRSVFTEYFPVRGETFHLIAFRNTGDYIEFTEVDNLDYEDDSDYFYEIDYDLGIIRVGGTSYEALILSEDIDDVVDTINVLFDEHFEGYPESGVLLIGSELVFYTNKGVNSFLNCTRGYDSTTPAAYLTGETIQHRTTGKAPDHSYTLYCRYLTLPKVRYEVTSQLERYSNNHGWLNLKPIYNIRENGIVQISTIDRHVATLDLEVNADQLFGNTYGPVYYGTDYRGVTATARDNLGNPVNDIEITIEINSGPGYLNYSLREYTGISNNEGEVYSVYGVPYDWESILKDIYSIAHNGGNTIMSIETLPVGLTAEQIQLYQIRKDDPVLGTQGNNVETESWGIQEATYNNSYVVALFQDTDVVSRYEGGVCYLTLTDGNNPIRLRRTIAQAIERLDANLNQFYGATLFFKESIPVAYSAWTVESCAILEKDALEFNVNNLNASRRVMYEWRADVLHPITKQNGAYYPIRPSSVSTTELTYDTLLPLPEPDNIDSNIGGYYIVSSDIVEVQARCIDPISGNVIRSEIIKIQIDIPDYLNGVTSEQGLPVPYGFKFIKDEDIASTGIGGANFLTINPFDYNITDLLLEFN